MHPFALLLAGADEPRDGSASPISALLGMPEGELVRRLRAGDEEAYTTLYHAFYPRLMAIATAYVPHAVAEELTQDVLSLAWERRATWPVDQPISIYLYATVRNRALKHVRHDRVVARLEHTVSGDASPGMARAPVTADVQLDREDIRAAVDATLARLSEGARTAFMLRWMHELSYPEIARIMETSEVTVRQQVAKARRAVVPVLQRLAGE